MHVIQHCSMISASSDEYLRRVRSAPAPGGRDDNDDDIDGMALRDDAKIAAVRSSVGVRDARPTAPSRRAWAGGDEDPRAAAAAAASSRSFDEGDRRRSISPEFFDHGHDDDDDYDGRRVSTGGGSSGGSAAAGGVVDVRSFHDVEAATHRVMSLLGNVRRLATLRDVVILTEESAVSVPFDVFCPMLYFLIGKTLFWSLTFPKFLSSRFPPPKKNITESIPGHPALGPEEEIPREEHSFRG